MTRPSDSGASGVDWSGELEAVHEDGRVVPARYDSVLDTRGHTVIFDDGSGPFPWCVDHKGQAMVIEWRIRNSQPQPADTATVGRELHERMVALVLKASELDHRHGPDVNTVQVEACAIAALLPDPVDPDIAEAQELLDSFGDALPDAKWLALAGIRRGRALATAEKALAWGEGE